MRTRQPRYLLTLSLLIGAGAACQRAAEGDLGARSAFADAPALQSVIDTTRFDVDACEPVLDFHHSSAREVVDSLVARVARGEMRRAGSFLPTASLCPGVEPGYDSFDVLDSVRLSWLRLDRDTAAAVLAGRVRGVYFGGFREATGARQDTMLVLRTQSGWRIVRPVWDWIGADEARRLGVSLP